jgi:DNA-binding GntR family transcriptional regulator
MYASIHSCILFSQPLVGDPVLVEENSASMSKPSTRKRANERPENDKAPALAEADLAEKFDVGRSPVREALLALEKEGTAIMRPYKGAIVKPLSAAEVLDIAELRLALISLALKPVHRHLSPADFDHAYDLAKRITRINNAKNSFEYSRHFWDSIFSKAQRPILREVFRQLEDRLFPLPGCDLQDLDQHGCQKGTILTQNSDRFSESIAEILSQTLRNQCFGRMLSHLHSR